MNPSKKPLVEIPDFTAAWRNIEKRVPNTREVATMQKGREAKHEQAFVIRTFPVCWGFPVDEVMYSLFFMQFSKLNFMPWDSFAICMGTYLPKARNFVHRNFVQSKKGVQYLVMLDSDVLPPPDFLERLLAHKKPLVGGWYKMKGGSNAPVVYDYAEEKDGVAYWKQRAVPGKGLEKVDGAGAGCWLMHREVAEAIGEEPYGEGVGEDFLLCRKVKEKGFDIYIDWDIACAHCGVAFV